MDDRIVHGLTEQRHEIVRYDRAGKWYVEYPDNRATQVSLAEAVRLATRPKATAYCGRPGGLAFSRQVIASNHSLSPEEPS